LSLLSDSESVGKVDSSRGLKPSRQYNALFWRSRRREIDVFVRLNDLARERLRAHPRVSHRIDLLQKRIVLLNHLALFRLGFVQQARQRRAADAVAEVLNLFIVRPPVDTGSAQSGYIRLLIQLGTRFSF
jgi:hypothetical protein